MSISLSKWPMLPTIAWCFIRAMCVGGDDVLVAGGGDEDVGRLDDVLERGDLVALHGRLQRADRVDLGDDDAGALAAQRLGAALADVAVAADHGHLAADHHVGGAVDAVDQRVAAAVEVVELRLGDRVVDVDRREEQLALSRPSRRARCTPVVVSSVTPLMPGGDAWSSAAGPRAAMRCSSVEDDAELLRVGRRRRRARRRRSRTRRPCGPAAWRRRRRRGSCSGRRRRASAATCSVHHQYSSSVSPFQAKTGHAAGLLGRAVGADGDRGGGVVLGREDVAGGPADLGAERGQRLDEHGGLDGHVQRARDARALAAAGRRRTRLAMPSGPGISCSARRISLRPNSASERSATLKSSLGQRGGRRHAVSIGSSMWGEARASRRMCLSCSRGASRRRSTSSGRRGVPANQASTASARCCVGAQAQSEADLAEADVVIVAAARAGCAAAGARRRRRGGSRPRERSGTTRPMLSM